MSATTPPSLTTDRLRALRLRAQWLDKPRAATAAEVVRNLCGVQAQDANAAALSIGVRAEGLTAGDVARARLEERSLVRTWAMRGALHLLPAEDIGWLLPLLAPGLIAGNARRYAELGLDAGTLARGLRALYEALAQDGPLTRAEIVARLAEHGVPLAGQARPYLIQRAALEGLICQGPDRGAEPAYALLAGWLAPDADPGAALPHQAVMPREVALVELARRYRAAFGPATPPDLAAWSGLPAGELRRAWATLKPELAQVETEYGPAWLPKARRAWLDEPPPSGSPITAVRLLPAFDTYLLGYRTRDLTVPRAHARRVNAGGGMIHPVLLVDGQAVGTWQTQPTRGRLALIVEPFTDLPPAISAALEAETARLARFLGLDVQL
jgi:hypothetical protein